jgi:hypothetical protein
MSVKSKLFAAATAVILVGGGLATAGLGTAGLATAGLATAGLVAAGTANAATPECGQSCWDIFSQQFGHHHDPVFLVDSYKQGEATGTPVILFEASNYDPALDFTAGSPDPVSDYWQAGLVDAAVTLHYGCSPSVNFAGCNTAGGVDDWAFEIQYAPYGAPTGECVGVAATASATEKVSLQPCGVSSMTLWIVDNDGRSWDSKTGNPSWDIVHGFWPLINGSDTNFSQPFVLTYPGGSYPTDKPRPQLEVSNLDGYVVIASGVPTKEQIPTNQAWGTDFGQVR